jgi:uncharacterized damage-inducible protein DinB
MFRVPTKGDDRAQEVVGAANLAKTRQIVAIDEGAASVYPASHPCCQERTMDPRYPIGKYQAPPDVTPAKRAEAIREIGTAPQQIRAAVNGLTDAQLDSPYREGGWTVRQVAHHLADSHMNAYVRWRLALTENEPTIKPYEEGAWANLEDAAHAPVEVSLRLLDALHERWVRLLRSVKEPEFARTFRHPEHGVRTLDWMLFLYAWHGKHHTAHVTELRKQKGW